MPEVLDDPRVQGLPEGLMYRIYYVFTHGYSANNCQIYVTRPNRSQVQKSTPRTLAESCTIAEASTLMARMMDARLVLQRNLLVEPVQDLRFNPLYNQFVVVGKKEASCILSTASGSDSILTWQDEPAHLMYVDHQGGFIICSVCGLCVCIVQIALMLQERRLRRTL